MNDYHINGFLSEMKVLGVKSSSLIDLLETIAVRVYKPQIILLSMPFFLKIMIVTWIIKTNIFKHSKWLNNNTIMCLSGKILGEHFQNIFLNIFMS